MKKCSAWKLLWKYKLKQVITLYKLDWHTLKGIKTTSVGMDVCQKKPSSWAIENAWINLFWVFIKRPVIKFPYDSVIPFWGIYSKDLKPLLRKEICAPLFICSIIHNSKNLDTIQCPRIDDWIMKPCYMYTMKWCLCFCSGPLKLIWN